MHFWKIKTLLPGILMPFAVGIFAQGIEPAPHLVKPAPDAIAEALEIAARSEDWESTPPLRIQLPGVPNAWKLNHQVFAGDAPPGGEAMKALRQLGVNTLISIDLAPPAQYEAGGYDLDYVHIPVRHGALTGADYIRVLRVISYMKEHYYLHAGPGEDRALSVAAMATHVSEFRPAWRVLYLLDTIEFPEDEVGLWYTAGGPIVYKTLEDSRKIPADFPRALKPPATIWWMRHFDESFEVLRESRRAGWRTPPEAVGTTSAYEAKVIEDMAGSWLEVNADAESDFRMGMQEVRRRAGELKEALGNAKKEDAEAGWNALSTACMECHRQYRDQ